ncbi:MAG: hypothetical protein MRERC_11c036 [Mycoplasmataceae bacterium RC_NB112A]|nr:MAG: hypothetical protein MRERC_11c036 [Mycoplasmataceae bacterium RC_NB112A]
MRVSFHLIRIIFLTFDIIFKLDGKCEHIEQKIFYLVTITNLVYNFSLTQNSIFWNITFFHLNHLLQNLLCLIT